MTFIILFAILEFCIPDFSSGNINLSKNINAYSDGDPIPTVMFEITTTENDYVSYIFGTHHAFGKSFFDSLDNANEKLMNSNILIKENLNIPGHLFEDIVNKRDKKTKWLKYLNEADYQYVKHIFSNSKADLSRITPTELSAVLNRYYKTNVCKSKQTIDPFLSLDEYIGELATQNNLLLIGLETTEEQLEIIGKDVEGMPRKVHKKRLTRLIERIRSHNTNECFEIDWYASMMFDYKFNQPCTNALVLTERNNKWMQQINKNLMTNNCFIAVGLSHLMFECGLIHQLKDLGYKVTPIPLK